MLILFIWASLNFVAPSIMPSTTSWGDSIQARQQDTVNSKKPDIFRQREVPQDRPLFWKDNYLFGPQTDQQSLRPLLDSLLRINPTLKTPLLKELLIPSGPLARYPPASALDLFNQELARDGRVSTFERMGLIARRYAVTNPNALSYSTHQIDIIGTILWLSEVLK